MNPKLFTIVLKKSVLTFWIIGILFCCMLFSSCFEDCSKKILCPGFKDTLFPKWFPYTSGMKISFATNSNRIQHCTLDTLPSTIPYEINSRYGCDAEKGFFSHERDSIGWPFLRVEMKVRQNEAGQVEYRSMVLSVFNQRIEGQELTDNGFRRFIPYTGLLADTPRVVQFHNTIQLNGKLFSNVQSVLFDTATGKKPYVYKIYIGKHQGLVAYETSDSSLLWVKQ